MQEGLEQVSLTLFGCRSEDLAPHVLAGVLLLMKSNPVSYLTWGVPEPLACTLVFVRTTLGGMDCPVWPGAALKDLDLLRSHTASMLLAMMAVAVSAASIDIQPNTSSSLPLCRLLLLR